MSSVRRTIQVLLVLAAAVFVAGCGGGGDAAAGADAGVTPTPDATGGAATVADPNAAGGATGGIDPVTGQPLDAANGASGGAAATVPDLVGDDVSGGLEPVGNNTAMFDAQALSDDELKEQGSTSTTETDTTKTETATTPKVVYTGAKIYVDGVVHSVNRNQTFPKGNPVFRLISVTASDVEIELVAGEFTSNGGDGTFLDLGDMVSLVNSSEQVTYRVKYLRPITSTTSVAF
jgi:hypothetical protein